VVRALAASKANLEAPFVSPFSIFRFFRVFSVLIAQRLILDFNSLVVLACSNSVFVRSFLVKIKCAGIYGVAFSGDWRVMGECAATPAHAD
jgi:hypothetical protein